MSKILHGPFISDKIIGSDYEEKENLSETEKDEIKSYFNESSESNFHKVNHDHYYFGVNLLNRTNYKIGNAIDQQLLKTIVQTDYFMNNGFYLKDKFVNFDNIKQDMNSFHMSIPLFGLYDFLHETISLEEVIQNELPFHLKYHETTDSDGKPIQIMSNFYLINDVNDDIKKIYTFNFLVDKTKKDMTKDDLEKILSFMDENNEKQKYNSLFKELINELNSVLKEHQEFTIIIFKKTDIPGLIVRENDLVNKNKFNCESVDNSKNKDTCAYYNTKKLGEDADLGLLKNMCNGEPNCKWENDNCIKFNCNEAKNETECKKITCIWNQPKENNKFKYIIQDKNNDLLFHEITSSDLEHFNLTEKSRKILLKTNKSSIFDMIKEKADTFILAEGFGRRITFIDIFLGLLVIVLLFRLKK